MCSNKQTNGIAPFTVLSGGMTRLPSVRPLPQVVLKRRRIAPLRNASFNKEIAHDRGSSRMHSLDTLFIGTGLDDIRWR